MDRETDRQMERQTDKEIDRERQKETDRKKRDRQRDIDMRLLSLLITV